MFVVRVYLPIVAVSVPRLRTCASAEHARRITTVWVCCVRFACEFGRRGSFGMLFD